MLELSGYSRFEAIHRGRRSEVLRGQRASDGLSVVVKTPAAEFPTSLDLRRLRHEFDLGRSASHGPARQHLVRHLELLTTGSSLVLVLEDFGGVSLERGWRAADASLREFLDLAIALSQAVQGLHDASLVHLDINPSNVLHSPTTGAVRLCDLSTAVPVRGELLEPPCAHGSPPHASPEQARGAGASRDLRSDLYSLGVTLFELLTGRVPFRGSDALETLHHHLAAAAPSPREFRRDVPDALAEILLRLLSKEKEDRYRSAHGLRADLARCRDELAASGTISVFELGSEDAPPQFLVQERLYGREREQAALSAAFEQVADGARMLALISGEPGVGKSSLVETVREQVSTRGGNFCSGKFELLRGNMPYGAFSGALRAFVRAVLVRPAADVRRWRERILAATGTNGGLLVRLVPELERLIGPQPDVAALEPEQANARFRHLVLGLIEAMAPPGSPLLLFLDDLQWAEQASLSLIEQLLAPERFGHLMLVVAYRKNELSAGHPVSEWLKRLRRAGNGIELDLEPLTVHDVARLVADSLLQNAEVSSPLADLVWRKTGGNPFFLRQFLKMLHDERAVSFDAAARAWRWDLEACDAQSMTSNVVDLTARRLHRLGTGAQEVLRHASCIGSEFAVSTLALVLEQDEARIHAALEEAIDEELITPLHGESADSGSRRGASRFRFLHDQVQQAAYALIPDADRAARHLSIGRLLLGAHPPSEQEAWLFHVLDHLLRGVQLVTLWSERVTIAELCLAAGRRAKAANAHAAAARYLRSGVELVGPSGWGDAYQTTLALHVELAECSYLQTEFDVMAASCSTIDAHARTLADKLPAYLLEIIASMGRRELSKAIARAISVLGSLGVELPARPNRAQVALRLARTAFRMRNETEETLLDRGAMTDPRALAAMEILALVATAAYLTSPNLFPLIICEMLSLTLEHGISEWAADAFLGWGAIQIAAFGNVERGHAVGSVAPRIVQNGRAGRRRGRIQTNYNLLIRHWREPLRATIEALRGSAQDALEHGDLAWVGVAACTQIFNMLVCGCPLPDVEEAAVTSERLLRRLGQERYLLDMRRMLQFVRCLQGNAPDPALLRGELFDEEKAQADHEAAGDRAGVASLSYERAVLKYVYGDDRAALECCELCARHVDSVLATVYPSALDFLSALVRTRLLAQSENASSRGAELQKVRKSLRRLERWARSSPENHSHRVCLVRAELFRLAGDDSRAARQYEQAIELAGRNGYLHELAMALECAGRFYADRGHSRVAISTLLAARNAWSSWGAAKKAAALDAEFSTLLLPPSKLVRHSERDGVLEVMHGRDLASVMKASQVIVGEIRLPHLVRRLLALAMENTGAQRGFLLLNHDGQLRVEAGADIDDPKAFSSVHSLPAPEAADLLPVSIVEYVARVTEIVVHPDVAADALFAHDPYVSGRRPLSILCVPLVSQGVLSAIVYLENNRMRGAFDSEHVEGLHILSSLAAISLENARLYEDVARVNALQTRVAEAQARFVPAEFLRSLQRQSIVDVSLGDNMRKEMSILFSDVRGFTRLVERMPASEHIGFINAYLGRMEPPIVENGGFVDSYLGDGIMALFEGSADNALLAAIQMSSALSRFNDERRAESLPPIEMGIGVSTGMLTLGTIGGPMRIKCGVIGDPVNIASRVESLTKHLGSAVLVSHHTRDRLRHSEQFELRAVDRVRVKGKDDPITLFEVLDAEPPRRAEGKRRTRALFEQARTLYTAGSFEHAERLFHDCLSICPEDGAAAHLAARARRHQAEPLKAWDGIETLREK